MKNILITTSLLFLFTSCDKELEQEPFDGLTSEALFTDIKGFNTALNGCYNSFTNSGYYGNRRSLLTTADVPSDNLIFNPQGRGTQKTLNDWNYNANRGGVGIYGAGYTLVAIANRILDNIDNIEKSDDRDNIEGQALALRAMAHFDIVRTYSKIPTQSADANNSMGIAYVEHFKPSEEPVRDENVKVSDTYKKVVDDLLAAEEKIAEDNGKGYLNKAAVAGILTRVYLYMGSWNEVIKQADIATKSAKVIAPSKDFRNVWLDEYEGDVLFKVVINDTDVTPSSGSSHPTPGVVYSQGKGNEHKAEYVLAYDFYQLFKDTDIRKSATIISNSPFSGKKYNVVSKYLGRNTGNASVVDGKYLRVEEVYLNKAEAYYNLGQSSQALAALDELRKNRYKNFVSPKETGKELEEAIQLERRLELAFEGDRFYTLKRRGESVKRSEKYGEFSDGTGTPAIKKELPAGDYRWQMPIPQDAIDNNPNIKQNPGYTKK